MKSRRTLLILICIASIGAIASSPVLGAINAYSAKYQSGNLGITVDGLVSDWGNIPSFNVTLVPAIPEHVDEGGQNYSISVKSAFNDTHIAFLIAVEDDYDRASHHDNTSALGVLFAINGGKNATRMGGTGTYANETSVGLVDIWHWELDSAYRVPAGGFDETRNATAKNGDDPNGNLDDEYSTSSVNRFDDNGTGKENSLMGAYGHSGGGGTQPANNTAGWWYFEILRPMITNDQYDVQFEADKTYYMNLAYWDSDQSPVGWHDDGHSVLRSADDAIELKLAKTVGTPGFEAFLAIGGFVTVGAALIVRRKK